MIRLLPLSLLAAAVAIFATTGCDPLVDESGVVTFSGQVLDEATNNPVPGAFVRLEPFSLLTETDSTGRYLFADVEVDSTTQSRIIVSKDGFTSASETVLAVGDRVINVPTLRLRQTAEQGPVSGQASNILLLAQSAQNIGVQESGSEEVAQIVFQVADSLGRPVTVDNSVTVRFAFGQHPGGGEFLFPAEAATDNNGRVTANLSSGTRAGVVQVVAVADVGGRTLRSLPVSVAIHGGLPAQSHFSVGPERFNFPGLTRYGLTDPVSVIVGDKYANPVRPGTAVYFTSTHGVIEGSVLTDGQGRGTVDLLSANPLPPDGIAHVFATTADDAQAAVTGRTGVVFSGVPIVTVSPDVARLGQTYELTVSDRNNNPLAAGTTISVAVEGTRVKAVGHTAVELDDTVFIGGFEYENVHRGAGVTSFTFSAVENLNVEEQGDPKVESITITVDGPNGGLEIVLSRDQAAVTTTDGAVVERISPGAVEVRAPDY